MPQTAAKIDYEALANDFRHKQACFEQIKARLEADRLELIRAEVQLAEEKQDVEELQKTSLKNLILKLSRDHEDHLEREAEDVVRAKLKLDELRQAVEHGEAERNKLTADLADLRSQLMIQEREAADRKAELRTDPGHPFAAEDLELEDQQQALRQQLTEIQEAHRAGREVLHALSQVADHLDGARKWATYDVWGGSGAISHVMKYDRINEAERAAYDVNLCVRDYLDELKDVEEIGALELNQLSAGMKVADYVFDNIFTDLSVRNTIRENEQRVAGSRRQVERIQQALEENREHSEQEIRRLERKRDGLIAGYLKASKTHDED